MCGGSGSGKSTLALIFGECGIPFVDADAVYHDLVSKRGKLTRAIADRFGADVLCDSGALDRKKLSERIFGGSDVSGDLAALNDVTMTYILPACRRRIRYRLSRGADLVLFDAPLLFESGFDRECDLILGVVADREARIGRIMARDGITRERAISRIDSQISDEEIVRRSDFVIENNSSAEDLRRRCDEVIRRIRERKGV